MQKSYRPASRASRAYAKNRDLVDIFRGSCPNRLSISVSAIQPPGRSALVQQLFV